MRQLAILCVTILTISIVIIGAATAQPAANNSTVEENSSDLLEESSSEEILSEEVESNETDPSDEDEPDESESVEDDPGNESECNERIDQNTKLCDVSMSDGRARLVIESDRPQAITLTDAGGFFERGEVRQKDQRLYDGRNVVTIQVTQHDGYAGVSIATNEVLYALPLERRNTLLGGPWTATDAQLAALGAALSVSFVALVLAIRAITGRTEEPERIA